MRTALIVAVAVLCYAAAAGIAALRLQRWGKSQPFLVAALEQFRFSLPAFAAIVALAWPAVLYFVALINLTISGPFRRFFVRALQPEGPAPDGWDKDMQRQMPPFETILTPEQIAAMPDQIVNMAPDSALRALGRLEMNLAGCLRWQNWAGVQGILSEDLPRLRKKVEKIDRPPD